MFCLSYTQVPIQTRQKHEANATSTMPALTKEFLMSAASGVNTAPVDGSAKPLGYLDMSEESDLLKALQKIVDTSESEATFEHTISHTAKGGIDVLYDSVVNKLVFQKKRYSTNAYGVQSANYAAGTAITLKKVAKRVSAIEGAQHLAHSQLQQIQTRQDSQRNLTAFVIVRRHYF